MSNPSLEAIISKNNLIRDELSSLISGQTTTTQKDPSLPDIPLKNPDVILTPNEVNLRHGTGVIVRNIFSDSDNILSIRFHNYYDGKQDFGDVKFCFCIDGLSRAEAFTKLTQLFQGIQPKRILCVVYSPQEVIAAIALKEIFNAPLCTYIMDDNNLYTSDDNTISSDLMEELLQKSSLRLAISPELRVAYEQRYGLKFWLLPPIIAPNLITEEIPNIATETSSEKRGILIGNIWSQQYLDYLRDAIRDTSVQVDWYFNNYYNPAWLTIDEEEFAKEGIFVHPPLAESDLRQTLKKYKFAIIPSGKLDTTDNIQNIARLSLPTRIPFILATSNTPLLVLGSKSTAAARFVARFEVGMVCDYNPEAVEEAVSFMDSTETQQTMRQKAVSLAKKFSSEGIAKWLWDSLEKGEPSDDKFENLMPLLPKDFAYYIEDPTPKSIWRDFAPVYQSLKRLRKQGFNPNFVIDVGASTGIWSDTVNYVFPDAKYILVDPLFSKYDSSAIDYYIRNHKNFEMVEAMVSNKTGEGTITVTEDLYNSSAYDVNNAEVVETITSPIITLDQLLEEKSLTGRGLLKLDVQFAEHLAIEGGHKLLELVDVCIIELSLWKTNEDTKSIVEMIDIMAELGFRFYDEVGYWRMPQTGTLFQKDIVFVKNPLYLEPDQLL
ncbi:FkbM family methyltransferase [Crocosphaera sp. Alani8]|uniref:FkbM family methyltransferase n=1 Tax=Crocosphaera sp. Alani8 TaxID=3038952 RepID=UPI00313B68A6